MTTFVSSLLSPTVQLADTGGGDVVRVQWDGQEGGVGGWVVSRRPRPSAACERPGSRGVSFPALIHLLYFAHFLLAENLYLR